MGERPRDPEEEGQQFLKEKYQELPNSPEVESAVKRQEIRTGEKVTKKPEKIGAYLDRLQEVFDNPDEAKRERVVDVLKEKLHEQFVIKEIPESYFVLQQKIARERGHGDVAITDTARAEAKDTITKDQEQSLDNWVDYLGSKDATYPNWLKYWAFRSVTSLSSYDKEKHEFKKRSKDTVAPFPDINREALAYVLDAVEKKRTGKAEEITDEDWAKLLKTENFGKLYAHAIEKVTPASEAEKENIKGEWVKYEQGSDAKPLYESLQGKGTGWCTAGESMAKTQLEAGDFYVFYSNDAQGLPKTPRVAIRMENGEIAEVRGVEAEQNLEGVMVDIAKEKYSTLPGGEKYEKRASDMKRLTEIGKKFTLDLETAVENEFGDLGGMSVKWIEEEKEKLRQKNRQVVLSKEELSFLYEIGGKIEGFGYQKDPRISEIKASRDQKKDYAEIFDCTLEQVILAGFEINDRIVVVVGDLKLGGLTTMFSDLKFILGNADFHNAGLENLGQLEEIQGNVKFASSEIKSLGKLRSIGGDADFKFCKIGDLGKLKTIRGNAYFSQAEIKSLGELESIEGRANFERSKIKSLGQLKTIGGGVDFDGSEVEDLGQLQSIGGTALFERSKIKSLGQLETIGGDANFESSQVSNLGKLQSVGGNVFAHSEFVQDWEDGSDESANLSFDDIKVGGSVIRAY